MSNDENKYFVEKDHDRIHKAKREIDREKLREQEVSNISAILGISENTAEEVYELGFDAEAARILHLVPLIQVAWADGNIQAQEKKKILQLAELRGVTKENAGPGFTFLDLITSRRPSDSFFEKTNEMISKILNEAGHDTDASFILQNAKDIAATSGGFLGLGSISEKEESILRDFEKNFKS